jgi:hypothetical protein
MRSRQLETALTEFVAEAADCLQAKIAGGAEVSFELAEKPARRGESAARLYCYRALTGAFIEQHATQLASLPTHAQAVSLLVDFEGLDRYLVGMGGAADRGRMKAYERPISTADRRSLNTKSVWRRLWRDSSSRRARTRARLRCWPRSTG